MLLLPAFFKQCKELLNSEYLMLLSKTLIIKVLMFYEQQLSSILWPSEIASYSPYFYTIASLFNLEINIPNNDTESLMCFFVGMTAKEKILASLIPSIMSICLLFLMFAIIKLGQMLKIMRIIQLLLIKCIQTCLQLFQH